MIAPSWSVPAFAAIADLCTERAGLSVLGHRVPSIENVIGRAMRRSGAKQPERYLEILASDDEQLGCLIDDLVVGETYFFREPGQWEFIRRRVIGGFLTRQGADAGFRAWSAGCATGEEAYTLAMVLDEEGMGACSQIVASDISRRALAAAARGRYRSWSLRGMEPDAIKCYFECERDEYGVPTRLRDKVEFRHLNLALDSYPSHTSATAGLDLILCRNVLIYFDDETIARVARRLYDALNDGGWLVAASSDPPMNSYAPFSVVVDDRGVFYRRMDAKADGTTRSVKSAAEVLPIKTYARRPAPRPWSVTAPAMVSAAKRAGKNGARSSTNKPNNSHRRVGEAAGLETVAPPPATEPVAEGATQALAEVRALAGAGGAADAAAAAAKYIDTLPDFTELRYLRALLLAEAGELASAVAEMRNVVYLDPGLAAGHFSLGILYARQGSGLAAGDCFRRARRLASDMRADDLVPLAEGEHAGRMVEAAQAQLSLLNGLKEAGR